MRKLSLKFKKIFSTKVSKGFYSRLEYTIKDFNKIKDINDLSLKVLIINILAFLSAIVYLRFFIQSLALSSIISITSLVFLIMRYRVNYARNINKFSLISFLFLLLPIDFILRITISLIAFSIINWNFMSKDIYHQFLEQKENKIREMKRKLLQGSKMYKITIKRLNNSEKRIYRLYQKLQIFQIILYFIPILTLPIIKMYGILAYEEGIINSILLYSVLSVLCRNIIFYPKNLLYISLISVLIWII